MAAAVASNPKALSSAMTKEVGKWKQINFTFKQEDKDVGESLKVVEVDLKDVGVGKSAVFISFPVAAILPGLSELLAKYECTPLGFDLKQKMVTYKKWRDPSVKDPIPPFATALESVGAVICGAGGDQGKVVLVKDERNKWKLPGGYLEPNESILDALKREVKEETGIAIDDARGIWRVGGFHATKSRWPGMNDVYTVFKVFAPADAKLNPEDTKEISAIRWAPAAEMEAVGKHIAAAKLTPQPGFDPFAAKVEIGNEPYSWLAWFFHDRVVQNLVSPVVTLSPSLSLL